MDELHVKLKLTPQNALAFLATRRGRKTQARKTARLGSLVMPDLELAIGTRRAFCFDWYSRTWWPNSSQPSGDPKPCLSRPHRPKIITYGPGGTTDSSPPVSLAGFDIILTSCRRHD